MTILKAASGGLRYLLTKYRLLVGLLVVVTPLLFVWYSHGARNAMPRQLEELTGGFSRPLGIAVGTDRKIYVTDSVYHRIVIFDVQGTQLGTLGSFGVNSGEFRYPTGVAVAGSGEVFVADFHNERVQVFNAAGDFLHSFPSAEGNVLRPTAIGVTGERIYVADVASHQIVIFDFDGRELARVGSGKGMEPGALSFPNGLALDSESDRLFVADSNNSRVQVFTLDGEFLEVLEGGESMVHPRGLAYDRLRGVLYVADTLANCVHVFDDGVLIGSFGWPTDQSTGVGFPSGLAVMDGKIYIADRANDLVGVWGY